MRASRHAAHGSAAPRRYRSRTVRAPLPGSAMEARPRTEAAWRSGAHGHTCYPEAVILLVYLPHHVATFHKPTVCVMHDYRISENNAVRVLYQQNHAHPKTLFEIAMALSTNSGSFPSNSHVSVTFSILLRFGESWNPTNFERFNADGSLMGRTNLDKSVW